MAAYPLKGDPIRAMVNSPDVYSSPDLLSPRTRGNTKYEALAGFRDYFEKEIIGIATGVQRTNLGRTFIELTVTFYDQGGFPFYPVYEHTAMAYVTADNEGVQWVNTSGIQVGAAVESKDDILKKLVDVYYPKWGDTIPHVSDVARQKKDGADQWFLTFPNGYGQFLEVFDGLSLSAKQQFTGVSATTAGTTGTTTGKTNLTTTTGSSATSGSTTGISSLLTPVNIILAVAVIGIFGLIIFLTRKKPVKP